MAYDHEIATMTVFMEASGEPDQGKAAVAHVLVNRLRAGRWGSTLAAVCLAPLQFSSWNSSDPNRKRAAELSIDDPVFQACEMAVAMATDGTSADPTQGATFYFADTIAAPSWAASMVETATIGHHRFFKPAEV